MLHDLSYFQGGPHGFRSGTRADCNQSDLFRSTLDSTSVQVAMILGLLQDPKWGHTHTRTQFSSSSRPNTRRGARGPHGKRQMRRLPPQPAGATETVAPEAVMGWTNRSQTRRRRSGDQQNQFMDSPFKDNWCMLPQKLMGWRSKMHCLKTERTIMFLQNSWWKLLISFLNVMTKQRLIWPYQSPKDYSSLPTS